MDIMIIDDGVNDYFFDIGSLSVDLEISESMKLAKRTETKQNITHGTICAGIIKKYAPDCSLGSIKVLDSETYVGKCCQLVKALEWCLENKVKLIHMSIGTIKLQDFEKINNVILDLLYQDCVIVAAQNNNNMFTFPACLSGVIGVKSENHLFGYHYFANTSYLDDVEFIASSQHSIWHEKNRKTKMCNSFAAPVITAKVYQYLKKDSFVNGAYVKFNLLKETKNVNLGTLLNSYRLDFLKHCIVIGDIKKLEKRWINFSITDSYQFNDICYKQLNEKSSVLFIPDDNIKNYKKIICEFLLHNKMQVIGVIYAGIAPSYIKKVCTDLIHCYFWDESICEKHEVTISSHYASQIPIIQFEDASMGNISLVKGVKQYFLSDEYMLWCVSDVPYSYFYDFDYVKEELLDENLLKYYEVYHNLDILFVYGGRKNKFIFDMKIIITEENIIINFGKKNIYKKRRGLQSDSQWIYSIIKDKFM